MSFRRKKIRTDYISGTIEQRFWPKVDANSEDECWEWLAGKTRSGYGRMGVEKGSRWAHRISWEIHYGPIQSRLCVLHKCDNPGCVNPKHLFLGTKADNLADAREKGRLPISRRKRFLIDTLGLLWK